MKPSKIIIEKLDLIQTSDGYYQIAGAGLVAPFKLKELDELLSIKKKEVKGK